MKKISLILCVLAIVLAFVLFPQEETKIAPKLHKVSILNIPRILAENGSFQPNEKSIIQSKIEGDILFIQTNGTAVKKGDKVMEIDNSDVIEEVEELNAKLQQEKIKLDSANAELAFAKFEEEQKLKLYKQRLYHAKTIEKDRLNSPKEEELRQKDIDIAIAKLDKQDAIEDLSLNENLYKKEFITAITLEKYKQKVKTTAERLAELQVSKKILLKGISEEEKVELRQKVIRAQSNRERGENAKERRIAQLQQEINSIQHAIKEAEYDLKKQEKKLSLSLIEAPCDGIFQIRKYRNWRSGGIYSHYSAGNNIDNNTIIADIIIPTKMQVSFSLHENDFHLIRKGMKAIIAPSPFPHKNYHGTISQLGEIGQDRNKITKEFSGRAGFSRFQGNIQFDSHNDKFYSGMSANIQILLEEEKERLLIPREALFRKNEEIFVLLENKTPTLITGRIFNDNLFEIQSGLKPGAIIIINPTEMN